MNEQQILDKTMDTIEETLEVIEHTQVVIKNNRWVIIGVGVVGATVGAVVSFWATRKYATAHFEEVLEEEVAKSRDYYSRLNKIDEYATPADAVAALIPEEERLALEVAEELRGEYDRAEKEMRVDYMKPFKEKHKKKQATEEELAAESAAVEAVQAITRNVFEPVLVNGREMTNSDWDYSGVIRSENAPFIISEEEFFESHDFEPQQMTFYKLDEMLTDAGDDKVELDIVGADNLQMFGKLPGDPNVLYIKDPLLKRTYEIALSDGSYASEVSGFEHSPEESAKRLARLRGDDD